MNYMTLTFAGAAALALGASGAAAQSAKFAANWAADTVNLVSLEQKAGGSKDCDTDGVDDTAGSDNFCLGGSEIMATIKVPQQKELLIGVSGVANLVTFTQAKGKNGAGTTTSVAEGTLGLAVKVGPVGSDVCANGILAAPGPLTFASRRQELSVDLDLAIMQGEVTRTDLAIEGDVTVALGLDTTAAHHFNFVAVDLDSGEYDVAACFDASGFVENTVDGQQLGLDDDTIARTKVALAHRMITVQEVRAVKDSIVDVND